MRNSETPVRIAFAALALAISVTLSGCTQAPKDETAAVSADNIVPLSAENAQKLDLKTEEVSRRLLATKLHVTGRIQADAAKEIDVSPRFSGRVSALYVQIGEPVKVGKVLAKVDSHEVSELEAELIEAQSKYTIAKAHEERERQIYEEHLQRPKDLLAAEANYKQVKVQLDLATTEFKRAEDLYKEKIASARDFQAAKAKFATLEVEAKEAETLLQREKGLYKNKAMLLRDLQLARAETTREKQHVETLKQRLVLIGVPSDLVSKVVTNGQIMPSVPIVSPVVGVVTDQRTAVGEIVSPDKKLMIVTDLSSVIMSGEVPEVDVSQVRLGAPVAIKVAAFPNEVFNGTISFVSDVVNPTTRTVAIRATLNNEQRRLKTNMFAEIDLPGQSKEVVAVPKSAIQERGGGKVVYVEKQGGYQEHHIEIGKDFGEYVEVVSGVNEGDKVATQGSLLLRTAMANKQTTQQ